MKPSFDYPQSHYLFDAKNKDGISTSQNEFEWIQYRESMDIILRSAGISEKRVFEIRGNHDKYGVPCVGHKLDFFSIFSTSARMNRTGAIQSISLVGKGWTYMFLGIDDSISVGLRGPSNVFGHPTDRLLEALDTELCYWDTVPSKLTRKVVFGHFPLSFTTSSRTSGNRYSEILSRRSVSAYLCGHLHAMSDSKLMRRHGVGLADNSGTEERSQFWEWELGDWKANRLMRILAIDRGDVSFQDIDLRRQLGDDGFSTTILITYPVDSRSMSQARHERRSLRDDINALVFSHFPIRNVTARVYDSLSGYMMLEEVSLQQTSGSHSYCPLFTAKWPVDRYKSPFPDRYFIQVTAVDEEGRETKTEMRPFSGEGRSALLSISWAAYFLLHVSWDILYPLLLWTNLFFLSALLLLPKLLMHFRRRRRPRLPSASLSSYSFSVYGNLRSWLCWFLEEGSRSRTLWPCMVVYLLYLFSFSWFRIMVASEEEDFGKMSPFGWTVESPGCQTGEEKVGVPDVVNISLPFLYFVVSPLFLIIYSLFAESSSFHSKKQSERKHISYALKNSSQKRWGRFGILVACIILAHSYLKIFFFLGKSYGFREIVLSPAVCWGPPVLLAAAIYLSWWLCITWLILIWQCKPLGGSSGAD